MNLSRFEVRETEKCCCFLFPGPIFIVKFSLLSAVLRTADGMNLLAFGCVYFIYIYIYIYIYISVSDDASEIFPKRDSSLSDKYVGRLGIGEIQSLAVTRTSWATTD